MKRYKILIVDDEAELRRSLADVVETDGSYESVEAANGEEAMVRVRSGDINLVLTDLAMPKMDGGELVDAMRAFNPEIPVVVMTGYATVENAVELLRRGAYDYVTKPFKPGELLGRVGRAIERLALLAEIRTLKESVESRSGLARVIGSAPAMLAVLRQLPSVARSGASVLLHGESGTGKEVVARAIHDSSPRSAQSFVTVNCGALPESLLENELFGHAKGAFTDARDDHEGLIAQAEGGTLLLDEIAEMSPATQVKLLRFLQEKEYRPLGSTRTHRANVRIIAATNRDLTRARARGEFREDLFYRLNIIPLTLPALRERKEDIPLLVRHFLEKISLEVATPVKSFSALAIQKLMSYDWPGNVRELENKIQQVLALASSNVVLPEQIELPERAPICNNDGSLRSFKEAKRTVVDAFELGYVTKVLAIAGGNISEAARLSGKHRRAFWEILKKHRAQLPRPIEEREEALVGS